MDGREVGPSGVASGGPAFDVVFDVVGDEESFEDAFDGLLFVVVEAGDGFELEAQVIVWSAFVVVEEERVGADGEGFGESFEDVEGRRRAGAFIAADLGDVDVGQLSKGLLGEAALLAGSGESLGERHGAEDDKCGFWRVSHHLADWTCLE